MSSVMLDWVTARLQEDDRVIVPLKALWQEWSAAGKGSSFERFARAVLKDPRFEEVYNIDLDGSLEEYGYVTGPRIKLRSRQITAECILRLIRSHNERVVEALFRAWDVFRADPESEPPRELHEAIQMLAELRPVFSSWTHLRPKGNEGPLHR